RTATDQTVELVLVETAAHEDPDVRHPGLVQQRSGSARELVQVSAVQPHREVVREPELPDHLDRGPDAVQRVVGVDEEGRPAWEVAGEGAERLLLARERLD